MKTTIILAILTFSFIVFVLPRIISSLKGNKNTKRNNEEHNYKSDSNFVTYFVAYSLLNNSNNENGTGGSGDYGSSDCGSGE